ncbi:hypothetical protein [Paenibacillus massiliensis]|uniref:hypothetical protein n=1 Tax=Paenibacillus massiliensis TaxID=225917 RepID=UPI0004247A44|nr:hypothetical protein [Paenibacillus massiliensis]
MSERIEEIKKALADADASLIIKAPEYISYLLKELETKDFTIRSLEHNRALLSKELEETHKQSAKWEKAFDNADKQYLKMEHEAAELRRQLTSKADKLAEAQQTITRYKAALEEINNARGEYAGVTCRVIARGALGGLTAPQSKVREDE